MPMDITRVMLLDLMATDRTSPDDYLKARTARIDNADIRCGWQSPQQLLQWQHDKILELNSAIIDSLHQESVQCVGAELDRRLVGYLFLCGSPVNPDQNSGGSKFTGIGLEFSDNFKYLYKAFVHPEFRGCGIAQLLLNHARIEFKHSSVTHIVTTTDWTNTAFLKFAESSGFEIRATAAEWVMGQKHRYSIPDTIKPDMIEADASSLLSRSYVQLLRPA